ncbi:unnamed protein product, partial [Nesidiocoris tenuis]
MFKRTLKYLYTDELMKTIASLSLTVAETSDCTNEFELNFVVTQVLALVAAPILRSVLHPSRVSSTSRNGFVLFMGLSLLFYAFG